MIYTINFRNVAFMGAMFIITFIVFVASSYAIYYLTEEVGDFADEYDADVGLEVNSIYTNIVSAFQIIFLILAIGFGIGFILAIIFNKQQDQFYSGGGPYG